LSEGDIRSVQVAPGYFTQDVQTLLPQYLKATLDFTSRWSTFKPWLPLKMSSKSDGLTAYSGFVWVASSLPQLIQGMEASSLGGAASLPYCQSKACLQALLNQKSLPLVGLIAFLPEHLADVSESKAELHPKKLDMTDFYQAWTGDKAAFTGLKATALKQNPSNYWQTARLHLDSMAFEGVSALLQDPDVADLGQAWSTVLKAEKLNMTKLTGLGTRPILMGIACAGGRKTLSELDRAMLETLEIPCLAL
jgi:hypothetical protein